MKIKVWMHPNGGDQDETIEVDDAELEGMSEGERYDYLEEEYAREYLFNNVDYGFEIVEEKPN